MFVGEIFRHGARSSDVGIEDPKVFPNGPGALTASGMRQHYLIGREFKRNYIDYEKLIGPNETTAVYVQSTQVPRTVQSAE